MLIAATIVLIQLVFIVRALTRSNREPASRLAWVAVILFIPLGGAFAYLLLGDVNIGRRLQSRQLQVRAGVDEALIEIHSYKATRADAPSADWPVPFQTGWSVNHFSPVRCETVDLFADTDESIERLVADIDAAERTAHVLFYIWLPDRNGRKVADALIRAAGRGVTCRALVDDLGSRSLLRSVLWREMEAAGVRVSRAYAVGNPLLRMFGGRIDIRNHRKIVVIDTAIAWCGSQNCADPEFLPKEKFGPWVDVMLRIEGTIVRQLQQVFVMDWLTFQNDDDITDAVANAEPSSKGFMAQVVATGPTIRAGAMSDTFSSLFHAAKKRLVVTTPYYVPNGELQNAIAAGARRGVDTTLVVPARNDDRYVSAASRSNYLELLTAGVKIFEFADGLLHTKSITVDDDIALIGSANIDRRSLELNYENNLLIQDQGLTSSIRAVQEGYAARSHSVTRDEVLDWPWYRRLRNNAAAMMSPIL
jgi:cardiolipin synthase